MTESVGIESPPSTGIEAVDTVVASLGTLDDLPVADHVALFERAHESLRQQMASPAGGDSPQG